MHYDSNWIYHNSHDLRYRSPFGAVPCEEKILIKIEVFKSVERVILRLWKDNSEEQIEMELDKKDGEKREYRSRIEAPQSPGHLWYFFIIIKDGRKFYYGNNQYNFGGIGSIQQWEPPSYQITVYHKDATTPQWFKEAVMYQIFVDRFFNGYEDKRIVNKKENKYQYYYRPWEEDVPLYKRHPETGEILGYDIYGGNLLGIIKRLPYLKDLGVNVLYLNPIFEAPSNHKYDTGDYKKIDPMFGDNRLFQELCDRAKELGIYIILDGVFSHTGSDSVYFNKEGSYPSVGAYQSEDSPYYSWYSFQRTCDEYFCWWGIDTLPNVNEMDPSYRDFIIHNEDSVIKYWMQMGAIGWRLDVADELPDEFIKEIRGAMKGQNPDSVLIGEVWEDASRKVSYSKLREYLLGEELDSVMNYPFRKNLLDFFRGNKNAFAINQALMSLKENYPKHNFYANMNLVGTHDVPRVLTLLGNTPHEDTLSKEEQARYKMSPEQKSLALKRLQLLSLVQMTFPGVPCIYYGDEAGMEGYKDPLNRGPYPWGKENKELLGWYKKVIGLRNKYDVFKTGEWLPLKINEDIFGYLRLIENGRDVFQQKKNENMAIVLVNRNTEDFTVTLDISEYLSQGILKDVFNENREFRIENGMLDINIRALEGILLLKNM